MSLRRESATICRLCSTNGRLFNLHKTSLVLSRSNMFRAFEPRKERVVTEKSKQKFIKSPEERDYTMTLHPQPREERMPVDQDWTAVWPTAQVFKPSVVPLPLRAGRSSGKSINYVPLSKYANIELLKINNFLHLTPPAIEKHCNAIKKFMTKFPEELKGQELKNKFFPLEITTSDFCFSGPAVRHPDSRICTLKIKLSNLHLDERARNKMILLLEERYDKERDLITIVTDRCPTRKQNRDYALYLLAVLYHESQKVQPFEESKTEHDDEKFLWGRSEVKQSLENYLEKCDISHNPEENENVGKYEQVMTKLVNDGESKNSLDELKNVSINLLGLKPFELDISESETAEAES